jgi:hypothetical protein
MIGTIEDIGQIAADPAKAISILKARAGFKQKSPDLQGQAANRFRLGRWNIELMP